MNTDRDRLQRELASHAEFSETGIAVKQGRLVRPGIRQTSFGRKRSIDGRQRRLKMIVSGLAKQMPRSR
jgi:hypothetical protein